MLVGKVARSREVPTVEGGGWESRVMGPGIGGEQEREASVGPGTIRNGSTRGGNISAGPQEGVERMRESSLG